jgi:FkbM family methyltransferase
MNIRLRSFYHFLKKRKLSILKYIFTLPKGKKNLFGYIVDFDRVNNKNELYEQFYHFVNDISFRFFRLDKPSVIFDLGASYGIVSLHYYHLFKRNNIKIYAFEPNPLAYDFAINLYKNNNINNIILENLAVSNKNGKLDFYYNPNHFESASFIKNDLNKNGKIIKVNVVRFVDYLDKKNIQKIDFLKMDIEGAEFVVFEDLDKNGWFNKIEKLFAEVHCVHSNMKNTSFAQIIYILEKNAFYYKIISAGSERDTFRLLVWASKKPIIV